MKFDGIPRQYLRHPACWGFAVCWLLSAIWLLIAGHGVLVITRAGMGTVLLVMIAVTCRFTEPPPTQIPPDRRLRGILWLQLALLAAVVIITTWTGLAFHRVIQGPISIPIWTDLVDWFGQLGERSLSPEWVGGPYNALANPASYFLIPLALLVPLTGLRYLGFGPGHRTLRVTLIWCAVPILAILYFLVSRQLTVSSLGGRLISHTLQNGPFEEFLFRGAIQTRLTMLLGPAWGIAASSLAFGLWHVGLGFAETGRHSISEALAGAVLWQAMIGLGMGVIYHRTRNLVASSVCHVVFNSVG